MDEIYKTVQRYLELLILPTNEVFLLQWKFSFIGI